MYEPSNLWKTLKAATALKLRNIRRIRLSPSLELYIPLNSLDINGCYPRGTPPTCWCVMDAADSIVLMECFLKAVQLGNLSWLLQRVC